MIHTIDAINKKLIFDLDDNELNDMLSFTKEGSGKLNKFVENFITNEINNKREDIIIRIKNKMDKSTLTDLIEIKKIVDKQ